MSVEKEERAEKADPGKGSQPKDSPPSGRDNGPGAVPGFKWRTRAALFGIPLICVAFGTDERGKMRVAKGFIAIGQFAVGGLAIAQFGVGIIGIGQFVLGVVAFGQLAIGILVGFGQLAIGAFAAGQFVIGIYARGQFGWATYLLSPGRTDMEAVAMFETIEWMLTQDLATIWKNIIGVLSIGK